MATLIQRLFAEISLYIRNSTILLGRNFDVRRFNALIEIVAHDNPIRLAKEIPVGQILMLHAQLGIYEWGKPHFEFDMCPGIYCDRFEKMVKTYENVDLDAIIASQYLQMNTNRAIASLKMLHSEGYVTYDMPYPLDIYLLFASLHTIDEGILIELDDKVLEDYAQQKNVSTRVRATINRVLIFNKTMTERYN